MHIVQCFGNIPYLVTPKTWAIIGKNTQNCCNALGFTSLPCKANDALKVGRHVQTMSPEPQSGRQLNFTASTLCNTRTQCALCKSYWHTVTLAMRQCILDCTAHDELTSPCSVQVKTAQEKNYLFWFTVFQVLFQHRYRYRFAKV